MARTHCREFCAPTEDMSAGETADSASGENTPVIAKLEKPEAIENLDAIRGPPTA